MDQRHVSGITMHYESAEETTADLIAAAVEETAWVLQSRWSLELPPDCHLVVMTSWAQFLYHAAPLIWRIGLAASFPFWVLRVRAMWRVAGGWTNRFGKRVAVGIKPPGQLARADRRIGERIFVHVDDPQEKVRQITCHELTHAATSLLKLPMWINEGLATRAVDHFCGHSTIRMETLQLLQGTAGKAEPIGYRRLPLGDQDLIVYHFARGYWLTRWLDEDHPDVLARLITGGAPDRTEERLLAETFGLPYDQLWPSLDARLLERFQVSVPYPHAY